MTRRDRDGELLEDEPAPVDHDEQCVDGWLGEDHLGRPIPCPTCRPHLFERRPRRRVVR